MSLFLLLCVLQPTLFILIVCAVRAALGNRLAPVWRVVLWDLAAFRLAFPNLLGTRFSLLVHLPAAAYDVPEGGDWLFRGLAALNLLQLLAVVPLLAVLVAWVRTCRAYRGGAPLESPVVERVLAERPLRRRVRFRVHPAADAPLTYGVLRPVVVLPESADLADEEALRYILLHELTHVARFDCLQKLFFTLTLCLHWFNPAAWLLLALAGRDLEHACDAAVLRRCGMDARKPYAAVLLHAATAKRRPLTLALRESAVGARIRAIADWKPRAKWVSMLSAAFVLALFVLLGAAAGTGAVGAAFTGGIRLGGLTPLFGADDLFGIGVIGGADGPTTVFTTDFLFFRF